MKFKCKDCGAQWQPDGLMADGSICDDLNCRHCQGRECPECGSNEIERPTREDRIWEALQEYEAAFDPNNPATGALSASEERMVFESFCDKLEKIFKDEA
jgi:hypothetical protein